MESYKRVQRCELCGQEFLITKKFSRAKRCTECLMSIKYGRKCKEEEKKGTRKVIKLAKNVSKLDTLAALAKEQGMSYGQYIALQPLRKVVTHA